MMKFSHLTEIPQQTNDCFSYDFRQTVDWFCFSEIIKIGVFEEQLISGTN